MKTEISGYQLSKLFSHDDFIYLIEDHPQQFASGEVNRARLVEFLTLLTILYGEEE